MIDFAPLETFLAVFAPSKLLRLHHATLTRTLKRALLCLDACQTLLCLVLPLLLVGLLQLYFTVLLGSHIVRGRHQSYLAIQDLHLFLVHSIRDAKDKHVPSILWQGHCGRHALWRARGHEGVGHRKRHDGHGWALGGTGFAR